MVFTPRAPAQDAATQAQLDKITGDIQDIEDQLHSQGQQISDLQKKVSEMQDKLSTPAANNSASADDLKQLAEQVQEIDKKRQEDNQKILDALEKLSKGGGFHRPPPSESQSGTTSGTSDSAPTTNNGGPQNGYEYTIASGDTLTAIVKAYRAQGVKVTLDQVLKANPGLNPKNLIVGKKIFIPAPQ
jgi:LysM repeat protein